MRRLLLISIALSLPLAAAEAGAATKLTSKNSVSFPFFVQGVVDASGAGCGSSASVTFAAPEGARKMAVTVPKIGDAISGVRVASITVAENVATIGLVGDGAEVCVPASVPWAVSLKVEAEYNRRVRPTVREDMLTGYGAKQRIKPKTIWSGRGATGEKFYGLKWRGFGSKRAVGNGRIRQLYCRSGDFCPQNKKRAKLTLSNPGFCTLTGKIEYRHIKISVAGRGYAEIGDEKASLSYCPV